jgi:hypothetical protein
MKYRRRPRANNVMKKVISLLKGPDQGPLSWPISVAAIEPSIPVVKSFEKRQYVPQSPVSTPILLTHFNRWSGDRHPKTKIRANISQDKTLEINVFAKILASSPRLEMVSRAILPSELMIKLGIVEQPPRSLLTPLLRNDRVLGRKAYVLCNKHTLEILGNGRHLSILAAMTSSSKGAVQNINSSLKMAAWRQDAPEFYTTLLFADIINSSRRIAHALKSRLSAEEPDYHIVLSWKPQDIAFEVNSGDSLVTTVCLPDVLGPEKANEIKHIFDVTNEIRIPACLGNYLLIDLWKYRMFLENGTT